MHNSATDTTEASAHRRDGINRRALLAVAGAGIAGSIAAVDTARAAYRPGDQDLWFTCDSSPTGVEVTASWRWEDGYSGEPPEDVAIIYWDKDQWNYTEGNYRTSDGVEFKRHHCEDRVLGLEFRHDDTSASRGTEYSASVRLESDAGDSIVYHDYTHTYGDTRIYEVNVGRDDDGRPTSTVRTSDDSKKWEKNRRRADWECG